MKIVRSMSIVFCLSIFMFIFDASGGEYKCNFSSSRSSEMGKQFLFNTEGEKGQRARFAGFFVELHKRQSEGLVEIVIKRNVIELGRTKVSMKQPELLLKLRDVELYCVSTAPKKTKGSESINKPKQEVLVNNMITFKYIPGSQNRMMNVFFQSGKMYHTFDTVNPAENWCSFRIRREVDEDINLPKGLKFKVINRHTSYEPDGREVVTFSFVDFSSGKKQNVSVFYSPFLVNCKVGKGMGVLLDSPRLQKITGDRLRFLETQVKIPY